jgi:SAM-dependent methyltransferase
MEDPKVLERMRADWNARAGEDAYYYVAFGRREQDDDEFFSTGSDMVKSLELDLKRLPGQDAALEIGCGPGRLIRPMSRNFTEIHGVDVSDEMIRLAGERLRHTPNAHAHHSSGADLAMFPDEKFDFVYSYAVFQHIPSREVVLGYLADARRVLKPGGILRCQINGLPEAFQRYNTWDGVRIPAAQVADFAVRHDFQLYALENVDTQYLWTTWRKRPVGWRARLRDAPCPPPASASSATRSPPIRWCRPPDPARSPHCASKACRPIAI